MWGCDSCSGVRPPHVPPMEDGRRRWLQTCADDDAGEISRSAGSTQMRSSAQQRTAARKGGWRRYAAESTIRPPQGASPQKPLIEIAKQDRHRSVQILQQREQATHLIPTFTGTKPKVGGHDPDCTAVKSQLDRNGASRFPARHTDIHAVDAVRGNP